MAMFGKSAPQWGNILSGLGAVMADVGGGQGPQYSMMMANRQREAQMLAQKQAAQQQLFGLFGGGPKTPDPSGPGAQDMVKQILAGDPNALTPEQISQPAPTPMPQISDPQVMQTLLQAQFMGADPKVALEMLKANQPDVAIGPDGRAYNKRDAAVLGRRFGMPDVVNDVIIDKGDPNNLERHIPRLGEGMTYQRDASGRAMGVQNAPGYVDALSQAAGVKAGAEASARSPFEFQSVVGPQGQPITGAKSALAGRVFEGPAPALEQLSKDRAAAAAEREKMYPKAQAAMSALEAKNKVVDGAIGRAKKLVNVFSAGLGSKLSGVPNTMASDLAAELETIAANIGFDELQAMRDNSPTGGALGQVAVQELEALRSTISSLKQSQSPQQLMDSLDRIATFRAESEKRRKAAFAETYGGGQPKAQITPEQARAELARRRGGR